MGEILFAKDNDVAPFVVGLITIDSDSSANRIVIINRLTMVVIVSTITPVNGIFKHVLPTAFGTGNNLLVGIVDDDRVYDCKFVDGVNAEIVDLNTL